MISKSNGRFLLAGTLGVLLCATETVSAQTVMGRITVTGTTYGPIYTGGSGGGGYWDWDGSATGDVSPGDYSDPVLPEICVLMIADGMPEGCSRALAAAGTPVPEFATQWQVTELDSRQGTSYWSTVSYYSRVGISGCYSNITADPAGCEAQYIAGFQYQCDAFTSGEVDGYFPFSDREVCNQLVAELTTQTSGAALNRQTATWFGPNVSVAIGPFEISLNALQEWMLSDQWNRALTSARRQRACEVYISVWDSKGCGYLG